MSHSLLWVWQAVVAAQAENPDFRFLFDLASPEHAYYRWRLFSLASGDSMRSWRVEPFSMVEGGPRCAHFCTVLHCRAICQLCYQHDG